MLIINNKELNKMIIAATLFTVAASVCGFIFDGVAAAVLILLLGVSLSAVFTVTTYRRMADIQALNSYLTKVLSGGEAPNILDQEEGELSILKTNIYKVTTTLKYQKELLSKDKKALADAIADISHQLKTPLTSMMVMNDLLESEDDTEKRAEFLRTQSKQLDRMNWLIQTLLKLSKIDAGTITMKAEEVQAKAMIEETMKSFEVLMELKNIKYAQRLSDISIKCDKNWTTEAIQNIVKNCIEHMDSGDTLTISIDETNIYKEISIEDTGCGIEESDLPHIFERFYKGKNSGKDSVGIGLALAKSVITSQKGDIVVDSTVGKGTKFCIRFYKTII